jgi:excisionase family DNA binding protein
VFPPGSASPVGYLSIEGAAKYASVSTKTIERWIQGGLPVHQGTARGRRLIRPSDIDAFLTRKQAPRLDLNAIVQEVIKGLDSGPRAA